MYYLNVKGYNNFGGHFENIYQLEAKTVGEAGREALGKLYEFSPAMQMSILNAELFNGDEYIGSFGVNSYGVNAIGEQCYVESWRFEFLW